jgi:hypothetical protein
MAHQLRFVRRYFQEGRYDISVGDFAVALFVDRAIHVLPKPDAQTSQNRKFQNYRICPDFQSVVTEKRDSNASPESHNLQ